MTGQVGRTASDRRHAASRALVAVGIAGCVVSGGLLTIVLALDVAPPPTISRALAAAVAASLVAASSGTLRVSVLRDNVRSGAREVLASCAVAGVALIVTAPPLASAVGGTGRTVGRAAPLAAVALVLTVAWLSRGRALEPRPVHRTTAASMAIAAFLGASLATSLLSLPDAYPFSRYPMYSDPRTDVYEVERVRFAGIRDDGSTRELGGSLSRSALLRLVRAEDLDALEGFARSEAARDDRVVEVAVELETLAVTQHPDPPGLEVLRREPIVRVELP